MKKILMIGTGGTIASEVTDSGLAPELIHPRCRIWMGGTDCRRMTAYQDPALWRAMYDGYEREGFSTQEMAVLWDTNPGYRTYVLTE